MSTSEMVRPEITVLTDTQQHRVLELLYRKNPACGGCGNSEFRAGDALFVGFLFLQEATDAYMVALTCTNPACPAPHTGITLHGPDFLPG